MFPLYFIRSFFQLFRVTRRSALILDMKLSFTKSVIEMKLFYKYLQGSGENCHSWPSENINYA